MNPVASHHALPSPMATTTKTVSFPPFVLTFLRSSPVRLPVHLTCPSTAPDRMLLNTGRSSSSPTG
ncbi:hypothetical protein K456DRAFT_271945 [Colletotrichum gloeosporioides 23]|nr:hypothetical protein K456DRAFT_271945 [Colletotrichum gloeosporioides 23]